MTAAAVPDPSVAGNTARYAQKKQTLIAAATDVLNHKGVRGMILADVAAAVGFNTTSVTYYFRKKEDLAAACILDAVERYDALVGEAAKGDTPADRVRRLIDGHVARLFAIRNGDEPPMAVFNDMRALTPGLGRQDEVMEVFNAMFRRLRGLLRDGDSTLDQRGLNARANLVFEQLLWCMRWISRYDSEDGPRVGARLFDILDEGLAPPGTAWSPRPLSLPHPDSGPEASSETFLRAATRLINQQGYRGASVEKISASLNVTKGSFYHHVETKDDLVVACFDRTYGVMRRAQKAALEQTGSQYEALAACTAALVAYQLSPAGPLLRTSALTAVPEAIQQVMMLRSDRVTNRFAAMISDGVAEGSVRPVDAAIAAQAIHAAINAVADLPQLAPRIGAAQAVDLFARPLLTGCLKGL